MNDIYQQFTQIGNNLTKHQPTEWLKLNSLMTIIMIIFFIIFLSFWLIAPKSGFNSLLFTFFSLSFVSWLAVLLLSQKNKIVVYGTIVIGILILLLITFIVSISWLLFLWNAYFVWKYESHTLPNLLTLIIGIGIIIVSIISKLYVFNSLPLWVDMITSFVILSSVYLFITMYSFLVNLLLYQFVPRHYNQDYLIVLGAGLINGRKVSNLLGARIERAVAFANKQTTKGRKAPKFIMSGGKGNDEQISEAEAMKEFAIAKGVNSEQILLEDKSRNTYQNMMFSKKIASENCSNSKFKATFFTNNYHLFRAAQYTKKAHLKGNGVGAPTRLYFLPNAIIREFAGYFIMHKKQHIIIIGLLGAFFLIPAIIVFFNSLH